MKAEFMQVFPFEIYSLIFRHACEADDGSTGCALSLVSRTVAKAAQPWRYHCVALVGPKSILAFVDLLERPNRETLTDGDALRTVPVRHLFLADHRNRDRFVPTGDGVSSPEVAWLYSTLGASYHIPGMHDPERPPNEEWLYVFHQVKLNAQVYALNHALTQILSACAPTLRTLTLNLVTEPTFTGLPLMDYPELHTLVFRVDPLIEAASEDVLRRFPHRKTPCVIPSLRRVHAHLDYFPLFVSKGVGAYRRSLDFLLHMAPHASHIHTSSWDPDSVLPPQHNVHLPPDASHVRRVEFHMPIALEKLQRDVRESDVLYLWELAKLGITESRPQTRLYAVVEEDTVLGSPEPRWAIPNWLERIGQGDDGWENPRGIALPE